MRYRTALPLLCVLLVAGGLARADGGAFCQAGGPRVASARAALTAAPASLAARFELADALVEAGCFGDAVHTLEDGGALHPRSAELAARLRTTRSLVSEQDYFAGKEQAEQAAKLSRNRLRCTRLADIDACDAALRLKPDDAQVLLAKGDALLKASRVSQAYAALLRAQQIAPDDTRVAAPLAAARAQRQTLLEKCRKEDGEGALQACEDALAPGATDEREILARMTALRQPRNQPDAAGQFPRPKPSPASDAPPGVQAPLVAVRTYSNTAEYGRSH